MSERNVGDIPVNRSVKVLRIDGGQQMRCKLNNWGIHVGDELTVLRSGILNGPIVVRVHGGDVALGRHMAERVIVENE